MYNVNFSIASLLVISLTGCNGSHCDSCGSDSVGTQDDSSSDCSTGCETGDSDTSSTEQALLKVSSSFLGVTEASKVIIDNTEVGSTDTVLEIPAGVEKTVEVGILDGPTASDQVPLHTLVSGRDGTEWLAGDSVITPPQPVTGDTEEEVDLAAPFNGYVPDGYWTCVGVRSWIEGDEGGVSTAMTTYTGGMNFHLPGVGTVVMNGIDFAVESYITGKLTSPVSATAIWQQDATNFISYSCHASDENGISVDRGGNAI